MKFSQLIGLRCRHWCRSIPINRRRHCLECGETFEFTGYDLEEIDHQLVDHPKLNERSVRQVRRRILRWKRKA